ncbi:putative girdin-like [Sesbania bispinosa]|nr:putative girdin-like [Sesbania bispinosa]
MSSGDFGSGADPKEANSSSSFSALLSDNPPQAENLVPIINVEDSQETESDLDSDLKENRNTPVYQTFLTEVYTFNSIYTTPASIIKFRSAPLDCGFLLENEDLPDRLRQILDKMPPKATVPRTLVNEKAMRRWLKEAGGEPDGQNAGGNVNQSAVSTSERRKKQKLDVQGENQSKPTTTEAEGGEVNSIFDHRFNVERVVSREFNKKEDRARVNKALESSAQTINSLEKSLSEYKNKLTSAENGKKAAENDKKTAETKYNDLNTKYSNVVAQQVQLKKDLAAAANEKFKACEDLLAMTE